MAYTPCRSDKYACHINSSKSGGAAAGRCAAGRVPNWPECAEIERFPLRLNSSDS